MYTYAVKSPLVTMAHPKFAPESTPSRGPIPKPRCLLHAWTRPTYDAKRHPDLYNAQNTVVQNFFVRAEGDAAASPAFPWICHWTNKCKAYTVTYSVHIRTMEGRCKMHNIEENASRYCPLANKRISRIMSVVRGTWCA